MEDLYQIYNNSVKTYNRLADNVENIYSLLKKDGLAKISKKNLMNDFDRYIQALLMVVACGDGVIKQSEFEFIKKIVRYKDYFSEYSSTEDDNNILVLKELKARCIGEIQGVPLFVQMLAAVDDALRNKNEEMHYSRDCFEDLLLLAIGLAKIDSNVDSSEASETCDALEPVMSFFNGNEIPFIKNK